MNCLKHEETDMPIYEFRCLKCSDIFEIIVLKPDEPVEMKCPKCQSDEFERIMSTASYSMSGSSKGCAPGGSGPSAQTRTCSGGSCTTYDIPGPA
ncbi:MAG: FmdB family zinc ribbon protein [Thermodesulfobacteriota bacterium]